MDYLSPSIHSHPLSVISLLNWKIHGQIQSGETSWSNLKVFLPHLSILLLMLESITLKEEAANQRVWKVCTLELGAFKQGSFFQEDSIDAGSQLPALPTRAHCSSINGQLITKQLINLQPSILRDTNTYFRLLKMFLRSHYWDSSVIE